MRSLGLFATVLLSVGLVFIFAAERILEVGTVHHVVLAIGAASVLGALIWRIFERRRARDAGRAVETRLLIAYAGVCVSLVLYALTTEWAEGLMGLREQTLERVRGIHHALWPALLVCSYLPIVFIELVYRRMPVAESVELRRVRSAAQGALGLALAFVFVFSINYVASERNVKYDLSYFKTTWPSDATLNRVRQLGEPLKVVLFFPAVNEVLDELQPYFQALDRASNKLTAQVRDHALAPELARQHRIRGNGNVTLLRGEGEGQRAETIEFGVELEEARSKLRKLDGSFQQAFMKLMTQRRELHLTSGHGERSASGVDGEPEPERTSGLTELLQRNNIQTRSLGLAQGLGNRVPESAPAVAVIGPRERFLPEEANALLDYVKQGGSLLLLVDPDLDVGLDPLLHGLGLQLLPGVLASEQEHLRPMRPPTPADRGLIYTRTYSSHPTVTVMTRTASRLGYVTAFIQGGALDRYEGPEVLAGARPTFPIRTSREMWRDLDGDYERNTETEPIGQFNTMAAVSVPVAGHREGRAVVIADGQFVTNQIIDNRGNVYVFADTLQWLIGEEQIVGETTSEEDVRIQHTRSEDRVWFYATSFGVPLPILGLGLWVTYRRRRRSEASRGRMGAGGKP